MCVCVCVSLSLFSLSVVHTCYSCEWEQFMPSYAECVCPNLPGVTPDCEWLMSKDCAVMCRRCRPVQPSWTSSTCCPPLRPSWLSRWSCWCCPGRELCSLRWVMSGERALLIEVGHVWGESSAHWGGSCLGRELCSLRWVMSGERALLIEVGHVWGESSAYWGGSCLGRELCLLRWVVIGALRGGEVGLELLWGENIEPLSCCYCLGREVYFLRWVMIEPVVLLGREAYFLRWVTATRRAVFCSGFQPTVEYQEMSKRTSWQRRVPEENSMPTMSVSVKRRLSSECSQCQDHRGMTTTCCPGSSKLFWWGFAPDKTDWTVLCTANWSWHPHQPAPVVKKNKPQSMFYKDAPFTKLQEKTRGLSALPWQPNSTAANRSWRRGHHSSPERPWSCRLRTPRRRCVVTEPLVLLGREVYLLRWVVVSGLSFWGERSTYWDGSWLSRFFSCWGERSTHGGGLWLSHLSCWGERSTHWDGSWLVKLVVGLLCLLCFLFFLLFFFCVCLFFFCVCVCVCARAHACVHACVRACVCVCVRARARVHAYMHVCTCGHMCLDGCMQRGGSGGCWQFQGVQWCIWLCLTCHCMFEVSLYVWCVTVCLTCHCVFDVSLYVWHSSACLCLANCFLWPCVYFWNEIINSINCSEIWFCEVNVCICSCVIVVVHNFLLAL